MKPNIVFLDEYSICGRDLSAVKSAGCYTGYDNTAPHEVLERCKGAEIVITNKVVIDAATMRRLPDLRLICIAATGMNNVDLDAAAERGIEVRNAIGYSTRSVAETTLCSALSLLREIVYYDRYFKSGDYSASPRMFNFDRPTAQIGGKNWGIVGLGNIGREVARLATAFGCEVRYCSTSGTVRREEYEAVSLDELLRWSDIVSVHCPLNEHTRNLIGAKELATMKPSAVIINVARGGIIDEQALADALNGGRIRGAALDVFSSEPLDAGSPLLRLEDPYKLLASPHNAWSTVEAIDKLIGCIGRNIKDYLARR
ncbi:MAG: hydroxyacid dehydrogenase [Alistipes sp.]|nr:hydroxyacid dehydrogenase [Alistipes sp.]